MPNLALAKIKKYYQDKKYQIYENMILAKEMVESIFVSCIFDWNKTKCEKWERKAWVGGSGYSLETILPSDIENVLPRINLGFTTRGCIRNCPFCIVPKKEGKIRIVGDLLDLWDGKNPRKILIMDNNILALPNHFELICKQARENKIKIDFNQGLDHRLLTPEIIDLMLSIRHNEYRFAFDMMSQFSSVGEALRMLRNRGVKISLWYVLVGFNTTIEEDLSRLNYLRNHKQNVFVQRYKKHPRLIQLARWANQHHIFKKMTYQQFLKGGEKNEVRENRSLQIDLQQ
jgi:hypothetical protein